MHHAYLYIGESSLLQALKSRVQKDAPGAQVQVREYERFGVEEARELTAFAGLRVSSDTVLLLSISQFTTEAQNALLKLFEEPQKGLTFILLTPAFLIPTLRSRLMLYPYRGSTSLETSIPRSDLGKKFLAAPQAARTAEITKLLKDDEGVKERVREFLAGLEQILAKQMVNKEARQGLADIAKVRSYVNDRSPALKMLLEHLALSLPNIKDHP